MVASAAVTSSSGSAAGAAVLVLSTAASALTAASLGGSPGAGQGSSTTRPPGGLNELTILLTIGVGQIAWRSIGAGPAAHTVAGVGVDAEPRDRDRPLTVPGLVGLTQVVVGAVG